MNALRSSSARLRAALLVLTACAVTACGSPDAEEESGAIPSEGAMVAVADPVGVEGSGTLWVDGVQVDNFRGQCTITRRNGAEDLGDLADREGLRMIAGVDNAAAQSGTDMSFKVYSDTLFNFRRLPGGELRGTLTRIAFEGEQSPKSKSTMLGMVSFTGSTASGIAIVAHIVCELQNKFN